MDGGQGTALRFGRYEVVRHIATGGMADIYLARLSGVGGFERHVALKTIRPDRADDPGAVGMFLDEARLLAGLHHLNIAQVHEVGLEDAAYFLAMEYVHGETARALLEKARDRDQTIPFEIAIAIIVGAAAGLHHAHEAAGRDGVALGIVHRDVSPSNILIGYDGGVKMIDFGIARAQVRSTETQTGMLKGKFGYMSPEQCRGWVVDRRSDVFALGIVLYELTTQTRAFRAQSDYETMRRIVRGELPPPSAVSPRYPRELEDVVLRALHVDRDSRYPSAAALLEALERVALRLGGVASPAAVARYLAALFGGRDEPWRADDVGNDEVSVEIGTASASLVEAFDERDSRAKRGPVDGLFDRSDVAAAAAARARGDDDRTQPRPAAGGPPGTGARSGDGRAMTPPPLPPAPPLPPSALARLAGSSASASLTAVSRPTPTPADSAAMRPSSPTMVRPIPVIAPLIEAGPPSRLAAGTAPPPLRDDPTAPTSNGLAPSWQRPGGTGPLPRTAVGTTARLRPPRSATQIVDPTPPPRWTRWLRPRALIALACAVVGLGLGIVVGIVVARGLSGDAAAAAPSFLPTDVRTPAPTPEVPDGARPDAKGTGAGKGKPRAEDGRIVPPNPTRAPSGFVTIRVESEPSGATVLLDGVRLGKTPFVGAVPRGKDGPAPIGTLKLRKNGYIPVKLPVATDRDIVEQVTMRRSRSR